MSVLEKNPSDFITNLRNNCDEIISNYTIPSSCTSASTAIASTATVGAIGGGFLGALAGIALGGVLIGNHTKGVQTASSKPNKVSTDTLENNEESIDITKGKMPKDLLEKIEEAEEQLDIYSDILYYCEKKNIDEVALYNKARVRKETFSKIRSMKTTGHRPGKSTIICLCLALNLNIKQTQALLNKAGYMLSNDIITDKIISYCIEANYFNIYEIENVLYEKMHKPVLFKY